MMHRIFKTTSVFKTKKSYLIVIKDVKATEFRRKLHTDVIRALSSDFN